MEEKREKIVEETKVGGREKRNNNSNRSKGNSLTAAWPRDVLELASGFSEVIYKSLHFLKNTFVRRFQPSYKA
ncbi:MAG: hypothetical protein A3B16_00585 [Candidatus Zambryskibacteria bacterium RIFCSPLOWO2_01_FULL_45_43]|uniref:Uncharacterized protein n=1 Tax=Candidatus Zambryskibacteria bacterium RIFCSPLOWO2_01_FULL_45_43 TaxID=1802762 RepID=A0A1G2U6G7_9BACT|nr:MAG: hypothetical protein A3B16_00585 [Candidatus Zambryskibacteria bacterium RIFCSPLOWO2_01_FULL_45_43]